MSEQPKCIVIFRDRRVLSQQWFKFNQWPPSEEFLTTLDVGSVAFFQRLEPDALTIPGSDKERPH